MAHIEDTNCKLHCRRFVLIEHEILEKNEKNYTKEVLKVLIESCAFPSCENWKLLNLTQFYNIVPHFVTIKNNSE